jgi:hypothetical protein
MQSTCQPPGLQNPSHTEQPRGQAHTAASIHDVNIARLAVFAYDRNEIGDTNPMTAGSTARAVASAAGREPTGLDHFVGRRTLAEETEETFLHALLDVLRAGSEHVGQLRALRLGQNPLRT